MYVNCKLANQRQELLWQTDTGQTGWTLENILHYCQCCYLINYPQKSSNIWDWIQLLEINGQWDGQEYRHLTNQRAFLCGPITGWIWLQYSQLIFSTPSRRCCRLLHFAALQSSRVPMQQLESQVAYISQSEAMGGQKEASIDQWCQLACGSKWDNFWINVLVSLTACWSVSLCQFKSHYPAGSDEER